MEAERFYVDNNIYDKLAADDEARAALGAAIDAGRVELIQTHVTGTMSSPTPQTRSVP